MVDSHSPPIGPHEIAVLDAYLRLQPAPFEITSAVIASDGTGRIEVRRYTPGADLVCMQGPARHEYLLPSGAPARKNSPKTMNAVIARAFDRLRGASEGAAA